MEKQSKAVERIYEKLKEGRAKVSEAFDTVSDTIEQILKNEEKARLREKVRAQRKI